MRGENYLRRNAIDLANEVMGLLLGTMEHHKWVLSWHELVYELYCGQLSRRIWYGGRKGRSAARKKKREDRLRESTRRLLLWHEDDDGSMHLPDANDR